MSRSPTTPLTLENQTSRMPVVAPEVEPPSAQSAPAVPTLSPASGSASPTTFAHMLNRASGSPLSRAASLLQLQRAYGNRYVQRVVALARGQPLTIQPKLVVGPAHDKYEHEADQVAERVLRMPEPATHASAPAAETGVEKKVQRKTLAETIRPIQRQSAAGEAGFEVEPEVEQQIAQQSGGGQPLPESVRSDLEPRFGADFSGVRVHTDAQAHHLNESVQARAFTTGPNIYFRRGAYAPGSESGQRLLAHELTHVVQQTGAGQGTENAQRSTVLQHSTGEVIQRKGEVKLYGPESEETIEEILKAYKDASEKQTEFSGTKSRKDALKNVPSQQNIFNAQTAFSKLIKSKSKGNVRSQNDVLENTSSQKNVFKDISSQSDLNLDDENLAKKPPPEPAIPWLKMNDLYMTLSQSGPDSWMDLVRQRYKEGVRDFTVFTGTHGNLGGQFLDDEGMIDKNYQAKVHTKDDMKRKGTLEKELTNKGQVDIRMIDIFEHYKGELRDPSLLRRAVRTEIARGQVVILAWCFSIDAFKAIPQGIVPNTIFEKNKDVSEKARKDMLEKETNYVAHRQQKMKIKDIVADIFGKEDLEEYRMSLL